MRKFAKILSGAAAIAVLVPSIALAQDAPTSVAGLMFWIVGYNLMYGGGDFFGTFSIMSFTAEDVETGYSSYSDWFFQMVFCATTASIVSGTVAERIKFWPFFIFVVLLTGFIYPIVGSWEWGGGFLDSKFAFSDFAGSTLVHSTGGWAALMGAIILGARKDGHNH